MHRWQRSGPVSRLYLPAKPEKDGGVKKSDAPFMVIILQMNPGDSY